MKFELLLTSTLLALPVTVGARIYRCETVAGLVFSDGPCSDDAELVELENDSRGISMGPPEEVRSEMRETREQWAQNLAARHTSRRDIFL